MLRTAVIATLAAAVYGIRISQEEQAPIVSLNELIDTDVIDDVVYRNAGWEKRVEERQNADPESDKTNNGKRATAFAAQLAKYETQQAAELNNGQTKKAEREAEEQATEE